MPRRSHGGRSYRVQQAKHWFFHNPVFFLKAGANFSRYSWQAGIGVVGQGRRLRGVTARGLWLAMLPAGRILYWRDVARKNAATA